jgi:ATP-binding cassette subfamily C protein CydC
MKARSSSPGVSIAALYRRRASGLLAALALALLAVAAGVGLLGVSGWFLTAAAVAGAGSEFNLFMPSALVRGLSFMRIGARYAERLAGHATTLRLLADLRGEVFRQLARLTPRQLARYRGGDLVARLTGDVDALDTVFLFVLMPIATALLGGAVLAVIVGFSLPLAGAVLALALLLVCLLLPLGLARAARRPGEAIQESAADLRASVLDAVEGHADIVAMGAGAATLAHAERLSRRAGTARQAQARIAAHGQWILQAAAGLALLTLLWTGLPALSEGRLSGAYWAGLLLAAMAVFEVAGPVMRGAARLGAARAAGRRIAALLQAEPDLRDPAQPEYLPSDGPLEARGVRYAYPAGAEDDGFRSAESFAVPNHPTTRTHALPASAGNAGRAKADAGAIPAAPAWVLDGVDLVVAPGERVAIAGASGSGKSTLLALLLRLDDPAEGEVLYAGCDLRACAQREVHRRIALLSQDAPIFLGTVRDNLLVGNAGADDDDLWKALAAARLESFVRGLPRGLDSWVGETGALLSAGQARRLCLARTVLSPAPVLLLDEPTAGLDAPTEADFLRDLGQAVMGRTVVLATHAALPPGAVNRAYRLDGGRLQEIAVTPPVPLRL